MERVEICGWVDHVRWGLGGRVPGQGCVGGNSDSPLVEAWQSWKARGMGGLPGGGERGELA